MTNSTQDKGDDSTKDGNVTILINDEQDNVQTSAIDESGSSTIRVEREDGTSLLATAKDERGDKVKTANEEEDTFMTDSSDESVPVRSCLC